jgi:hypothetical protein
MRTVQTNGFFDCGGFPLQGAMSSLHHFLRISAVHYIVQQPPFASIWIYSHPTACCFLFLLLSVMRMIFDSACWVVCVVAAFAASRRTNLCLRSCCVTRSSELVVVPANLPVFDLLSPGGGGCVSKLCWSAIGEEYDNERKWEALSNI